MSKYLKKPPVCEAGKVLRGLWSHRKKNHCHISLMTKGKKVKVIPLHAMEALGVRGVIAPTHSQPWH
jgi:hypothetical protein